MSSPSALYSPRSSASQIESLLTDGCPNSVIFRAVCAPAGIANAAAAIATAAIIVVFAGMATSEFGVDPVRPLAASRHGDERHEARERTRHKKAEDAVEQESEQADREQRNEDAIRLQQHRGFLQQ